MKFLITLFALSFSLSAFSWVPQTQDEKVRIGKLVEDGKIKELEALFKSGLNPNFHYEAGGAFLFVAVKSGYQGEDENGKLLPMKQVNQDILKMFIKNGANVNIVGTDFWQDHAINRATTIEAVKILLDNGADLSTSLQRGTQTAFSMITNDFVSFSDRKLQILDFTLSYSGYDPAEGGKCYILDRLSDGFEWDSVVPVLEKYHNFDWEDCEDFQ